MSGKSTQVNRVKSFLFAEEFSILFLQLWLTWADLNHFTCQAAVHYTTILLFEHLQNFSEPDFSHAISSLI